MQYLFGFIFLSVTISVLRDFVKKCWPNLQIKLTFGHYLVLLNIENYFFLDHLILHLEFYYFFELRDVGDCLPHSVAQPRPLFDPLWTVTV